MSTTVSYKGSDIATVSNNTKTLKTQGKYVEADIILTDVSQRQPVLQTKTKSYTPSETAQSETVQADSGYDGLNAVSVSVGAISSTYVGTGITRRDSSDLTASGATVSVPSGYYENAESKAVASGSATPPTTISGSQATLTNGTNTITLQKTLSVTPRVTAGYVSSGTSDNVLVSLNANVTTKAAATYHPSTSDQSIASGTYLTGAQAINKVVVSNLTADIIKSGEVVKIGDASDDDCVTSVTGTYSGGGGGVSNVVIGEFTADAGTGAAHTVTIPYTGSGYPIAAMVFIKGGAYNNTSSGDTDWYNSTQRYAVGQWTYHKSVQDSTPTYATSGSQNQGVTTWIFKNNASTATTYSRSSAMNTNVLSSSNATGAGATCVRFKGNAGKTLSYYTASTSYGLLAGHTYTYIIIYSS
jgi:hypothetical protein